MKTGELLLRLDRLELRVAELESRRGFICVNCGRPRGVRSTFFTLRNVSSGETITPVCSGCHGHLHPEMKVNPWRVLGPFLP